MSPAGREIGLRPATDLTLAFVAVVPLFFILLALLHALIFKEGRRRPGVPGRRVRLS